MSTLTVPGRTAGRAAGLVLRWSARGILLAIAAFWLWFCLADGLSDAQSLGVMGFVMMLPAAVIVLITLFVVWRWEFAGALLLLGVSALGAFMFYENIKHGTQGPLAAMGLLAVFVLPFLLPAVLLLAKCWLDRAHGNAR